MATLFLTSSAVQVMELHSIIAVPGVSVGGVVLKDISKPSARRHFAHYVSYFAMTLSAALWVAAIGEIPTRPLIVL